MNRFSRGRASLVQTLRALWLRLRAGALTPAVVAFSVATGLAIGLIPLYGMHGLMVLAVCLPLRLDSPLAFAATMISNPVTFPFLVALELKLGELMLGAAPVSVDRLLEGQGWSDAAWQLTVGTGALSLGVGALGAVVSWSVVRVWRHRKSAPRAE